MSKFTCLPKLGCKKFLYLFIIIISCGNAYAQKTSQILNLEKNEKVEDFTLNKELNTPSVIKLKDGNNLLKNDKIITLKQLLGADGNTNFVATPAIPSKTGINIEKFQQYYKNIKVQHGVYSAVSNSNELQAFTGEFYQLKNVNIQPKLNEAAALNFALNYVSAKKYAWEQAKEARDAETNPLRKQLYNAAYEKLLPKGELVIVKDFYENKGADLSYKFDIYAGDPMGRAYIYVNAHTGKIMLIDKIIKHLSPNQNNTNGYSNLVPEVAFIMSGAAEMENNSPLAVGDTATVPILTRYAGVRLMGTTNVSGTGTDPSGNGSPIVNSTNGGSPFLPGQNPWVLNDKRFHGVGSNQSEQTYDLNGVGGAPISVPAYGTARSFTDLDNNWTSAEHKRGGNNEAENDDFGFDAHWGAGIVYQYWKDIHGRLSFDNVNSSIKSYIHSGVAYDNAFWNGSVMTYGDGSYQNGAQPGFAPLTSLDVCGHEIGHGVCSFTSDLVYANESGAMNEGYSDIWAAMVENYALQNIDPTLVASATNPNGFKIWDIGEQIDANDTIGTTNPPNIQNYPANDVRHTALRYMDFPGRANNPSSYAEATNSSTGGAERWTEQTNCMPTLANDQCGVHNNSGVLNRMMYVLVTGATGVTNTRNALNLAAHGSQSVTNGEPYNVTGVGFNKAEKILYLTELMLTPNATFLQARNASVLAAETLYGKCSFEYKQTILAWHSVAVGRSSDTAQCTNLPLFSASIARTTVNESSAKSNTNCTDAVTKIDLSISVLTPGFTNPLTITITPTGTASNLKDYLLSTTTLNYAANESGLKKTVLSIYNDAEVEGSIPETIALAINATDGGAFSKDTIINVSIMDDDLVPTISTTRTNLLVENFNSTTANLLPTNWNMVDRLGASTIKWLTSVNASSFGFTSKAAYVTLKSPLDALDPVAEPSYDAAAGGEVMLTTPFINATGKSDIKVKFRFAAGGEPAGDPNDPTITLDFGEIFYSYDGITFEQFQGEANRQYRLTPSATLDSIVLPAEFNGRTFKLGFNWYNDANLAVPPAFIIDDVEVSGGGQKIETELNQGVAEKQFDNKDLFYKSADDGQVIARIQNNNVDLGCVTTKLTESGNGLGSNIVLNGSIYQRAKKVITITPSLNAATATYDLTFFTTVEEIAGLVPGSLHILKIKDGTPTSGTLSNTNVTELTPIFTDNSTDGYYTYTVTGVTGFSQFLLAVNSGVLPQKLLSFNVAAQNNKFIKTTWSTTNETIGQHTIERAIKGSNDFKAVNEQTMLGGNGINEYSFDDLNVTANVVYQYRLKSVENNVVSYSSIKQAFITGKDYYVDIAPNPSDGMFKISLNGYSGMSNLIVYSATGQEVFQNRKLLENNTLISIDLTKQPAGIYMLKINTNTGTEVYKLIVQ